MKTKPAVLKSRKDKILYAQPFLTMHTKHENKHFVYIIKSLILQHYINNVAKVKVFQTFN